jgi:excreted virulence factor EspC (type VII ESX diderm)
MSSPIEVYPPELRRVAGALRATADQLSGDLVATYATAAPDHSVNAGWAVTVALDDVVDAVDAALRNCEGGARDAADRLDQAAGEYERADGRAAERLRW